FRLVRAPLTGFESFSGQSLSTANGRRLRACGAVRGAPGGSSASGPPTFVTRLVARFVWKAAIANGDCCVGEETRHPVTGPVTKGNYVAVAGVHRVTGAVAEGDYVGEAEGDHRVMVAVAEGDFIVGTTDGVHRVTGTVAQGAAM